MKGIGVPVFYYIFHLPVWQYRVVFLLSDYAETSSQALAALKITRFADV